MTQSTIDYNALSTQFYAELDANDAEVFNKRLSENAVFGFNDVPPIPGRDAIAQFVADWKSNFQSVTHEITAIAADPTRQSAGIELTVSYKFPDWHTVAVKGSSFLDFAGDQITGYRVYVDTSRLS